MTRHCLRSPCSFSIYTCSTYYSPSYCETYFQVFGAHLESWPTASTSVVASTVVAYSNPKMSDCKDFCYSTTGYAVYFGSNLIVEIEEAMYYVKILY